uniref:C2H2-type domain-containing protein n=1 Tax=Ixodes ricinus TaxID=34613 RepID=V5GK52_IXORI
MRMGRIGVSSSPVLSWQPSESRAREVLGNPCKRCSTYLKMSQAIIVSCHNSHHGPGVLRNLTTDSNSNGTDSRPQVVVMETAPVRGKPAVLLKATEDISFRCCSCTYVTRDQHGIVSHLVAHGDEQFKSDHPSMSSSSRSKVPSNTQKHKSDKLFIGANCVPEAFARNFRSEKA